MEIEFIGRATKALKMVIEKSIIETLNYIKQKHDNLEMCVMFVGFEKMRILNKRTRNIDKTTDVLSFPAFSVSAGSLLSENEFEEIPAHLGDMAICLPQAKAQAEEYKHSLEAEISKLAVHSTLHLMGYDHIKDEDYEIMHPVELEIEKVLKNKKII